MANSCLAQHVLGVTTTTRFVLLGLTGPLAHYSERDSSVNTSKNVKVFQKLASFKGDIFIHITQWGGDVKNDRLEDGSMLQGV